ncbi:uncharacterized protein E0L32_002212 [Thyridium curvatum]|uniref:Uncharacterized protein n=1 Tax=Thyridium curvatum TaxID=1093900 RepID=A0A507AKA2_9PEZI|nr:uncharacterized protein E0L32_002212 [Thyridium curvatum]TPX06716.1 hypothetical protein E0L32_002212 [Thyridium curvatum]
MADNSKLKKFLDDISKGSLNYFPPDSEAVGFDSGPRARVAAKLFRDILGALKALGVHDEWIPGTLDHFNDSLLIQGISFVIWRYSQEDPDDAVERYNKFVLRMNTYYQSLVAPTAKSTAKLSKEEKEDVDNYYKNFKYVAHLATDNSPYWKHITKKPKQRREIMELAVTVTSTMHGQNSPFHDDSQRVWEERMPVEDEE